MIFIQTHKDISPNVIFIQTHKDISPNVWYPYKDRKIFHLMYISNTENISSNVFHIMYDIHTYFT